VFFVVGRGGTNVKMASHRAALEFSNVEARRRAAGLAGSPTYSRRGAVPGPDVGHSRSGGRIRVACSISRDGRSIVGPPGIEPGDVASGRLSWWWPRSQVARPPGRTRGVRTGVR